jgi:hypothetical protein
LERLPLLALLYQALMVDDDDDDDDSGAVCGMIGRGNRSTRRTLAPLLFCQPQIPHDLIWSPTRAAAVGNRRITTRATARLRDKTSHTQSRGNIALFVCLVFMCLEGRREEESLNRMSPNTRTTQNFACFYFTNISVQLSKFKIKYSH